MKMSQNLRKISEKCWLTFHYCFFIGSILYSLYCFRRSSLIHLGETYASDWETGDNCFFCWRERDATDLEWQVVKSYLLQTPVGWFLLHSLGFFIVRHTFPQFLSNFIIFYSSFVIIYTLNIEIYLIFLINCLIYIFFDIFLASFKYSSIFYYLTFVISVFITHKFEPFSNFSDDLLVQVMISYLNAKCLSASLDKQTTTKIFTFKYFKRRFAYLLYFPPLFFGPIYHFFNFDQSIDKLENGFKQFRLTLFQRFLYVLRILSWAIFFEISKQFIFSSLFQHYIFILEHFDNWSLAGYGFALTIMFYLKYFIIYGLSKSLSELDGLEGVIASPPECIAHMHRTSYLWRRFDQGLYCFLVKYFYKPLTGNDHKNPLRKILAGIVCFAIIAAWHDLNKPVIIWVTLNISLSAAEILGTRIRSFLLKRFPKEYSDLILEQFTAIIGAPYLSLAYLSNVFFLSNYESGILLWNNIYLTNFYTFLLTMIIFWSGNHFCEHINRYKNSSKNNQIFS